MLNFRGLFWLRLSCVLRKNIVCIRTRTRPIPNSTADSTRKKKVKESIFKLLYMNPITTTSIYRVTHKTSAVSSRCTAVLILTVTVSRIIKNRNSIKLISPKVINYWRSRGAALVRQNLTTQPKYR